MHKHKYSPLLNDDQCNNEKIEKKHLEAISDACLKLIHQCNKKELKVSDLRFQPHYSTVFKQLKTQIDRIMVNELSRSVEKITKLSYLIHLKNDLVILFNSFSKFIHENSNKIGTENSPLRKAFFVKVVHFQFLCYEIDAYFPGGIYTPSKVVISKLLAHTWWEDKFGDNTFVPLTTFVDKFKEDYQFVNEAETLSFRNSINFTLTNFTTKFEFDLFTRLYSPWERIYETWRHLYNHPGYLHFSTYGDTRNILNRNLEKPGTYVFRISCKDLGFWTIGYVKTDKETGQIKVDKANLIDTLVDGQKKNLYLYPNGEKTNPDLSDLTKSRKEVFVEEEDIQLYDCFESFKECKICRSNEKDIEIENCGHKICEACLKLMRKFDKKLCPFCNQKIVSTTRIVHVKNERTNEIIEDERLSNSSNDHISLDSKDSIFGGTRVTNIGEEGFSRLSWCASIDVPFTESPIPILLVPPPLIPKPQTAAMKSELKCHTIKRPQAADVSLNRAESVSGGSSDSAFDHALTSSPDLTNNNVNGLVSLPDRQKDQIGYNRSTSATAAVLRTSNNNLAYPVGEFFNSLDIEVEDDDIFSRWDKRDISRALRVARNDKMLARDILREFVPEK